MAGNHLSGRPRTRARVEDAPRVDALNYCRSNGLPTIKSAMPTGEPFEWGTCPKCEQPRRYLFEVDAATVCRRCAGLVYRSKSESNSVAGRVRSDPAKAEGLALGTMQNALNTNDGAQLDRAAHTLEIVVTMPAATSGDAAPDFLGRVQEAVLRDDLAKTSALLERVAARLFSGEETRVDKRGNVDKIPMRPDSEARLIGAFCSLSNLRANRAGLATQMHAAQQDRPESLRDLLTRRMLEDDHKTPEGVSLREILDAGRAGGTT